ncbi:MAG: hypothetical protein AAGI70_06405 [Pseudomonadota bacterium]
MRWLAGLVGAAALGALGAVLWWQATPAPLAARFAMEACQRVALTDETGREITGIEDIALQPDGALLLSAHDRLDPAEPDGGIYEYRLGGDLQLASLVDPEALPGGLRPHGINTTPDGFAFVNRAREGGPVHLVYGPAPVATPLPEAANDLALIGGKMLVTADRMAAGWRAIAERIGLIWSGAIVEAPLRDDIRPGQAFWISPLPVTDLAHANGIAVGPGGFVVAETRAARLRFADGTRLALPGGPDNLSPTPGGVIAALHPSLIRLALYRFGWAPRAPSRIVAIDFATQAVEILFDDSAGAVFSGATVAVLSEGRLVLGSVRDTGLLICEGGT